jgi:hypothetical protein
MAQFIAILDPRSSVSTVDQCQLTVRSIFERFLKLRPQPRRGV